MTIMTPKPTHDTIHQARSNILRLPNDPKLRLASSVSMAYPLALALELMPSARTWVTEIFRERQLHLNSSSPRRHSIQEARSRFPNQPHSAFLALLCSLPVAPNVTVSSTSSASSVETT